ncbi:MAG: protein kinase domain-containing protein [Planctomycetales bacterium]
MNCPDPAILKSLLNEAPQPASARTVWRHVEVCTLCQGRLETLSIGDDLRGWLIPEGAIEFHDSVDVTRAPPVRLSFLEPPAVEGDLGTLDGFRVRGLLGEGGMGIVLDGYDAALDRQVALKVLRPERLDEPSRARFVREAQAMARIRDDHVLNVFGVVDEPGRPPYLVMERIDGPTLAQRIGERGHLAPGEAVEAVVQAARGLQAAHAMGLIHRDIKPSNIMFDRRAVRWKLMDFGLAYHLLASSRLTQQGSLSGTPAYMSPEQAQGTGTIDARSDVYSLGLTLYEALTGETPFRGALHLVLKQIVSDEPRPPRLVQDSIPRDVEVICLKAIAKEPSRRYASAAAFCADLQHWQRDEPIDARPASPWEIAWRWARRNRSVAALSGILAAVIVGANLGLWFLWRAAVASAAAEHLQSLEADRQRSEAEASLRDAIASIDQYAQFVLDDDQLKKPELTELRKKMARAWAEQYRNVLARRDGDPAILDLLANGYMRIGETLAWSGTQEEAVGAWKDAARVLTLVAERRPHDPQTLKRQARAHLLLGQLQISRSEFSAAEESLAIAQRIDRRLLDMDPADPAVLAQLVTCRAAFGNLAQIRQDFAAAITATREVCELFAQLVRLHPDQIGYRQNLGVAEHNLGMALLQSPGEVDESLAAFRRAREIRRDVVRDDPQDWNRRNLAKTELLLAGALEDQGELAEAEQAARSALQSLDALAAAHPGGDEFQFLLASAAISVGRILEKVGRRAEISELASRSRALLETIDAREPDYLTRHADAGRLLADLIDLDLTCECPQQAISIADILVRRATTLLAEEPDDVARLLTAVDAWSRRAAVRSLLEDWAAALQDLKSAVSSQQRLLDRGSEASEGHAELLVLRLRSAQARLHSGDRDGARTALSSLASEPMTSLEAISKSSAAPAALDDREFRELLTEVGWPARP